VFRNGIIRILIGVDNIKIVATYMFHDYPGMETVRVSLDYITLDKRILVCNPLSPGV